METTRLLAAFSEHWRQLGYAEMTLDNYLRCVKRLPKPLDEVTLLDVSEAMARRRAEISPAALAYEVRAYPAFFGWLSEVLDKPNPAWGLQAPKVDEPPVKRVAVGDHQTMLATCDRRTSIGRGQPSATSPIATAPSTTRTMPANPSRGDEQDDVLHARP